MASLLSTLPTTNYANANPPQQTNQHSIFGSQPNQQNMPFTPGLVGFPNGQNSNNVKQKFSAEVLEEAKEALNLLNNGIEKLKSLSIDKNISFEYNYRITGDRIFISVDFKTQ